MRDIDKEDEETLRLTCAIEGASRNDLLTFFLFPSQVK